MVPPRKYVYKELRELAKKFKLPCNLKYEILAKLIRARLHGDHRLVERILNDLRRERTQRRIENTVLRSRIEESGGDPSQLKKVAARRRSNPPAADGAPAGGPPAAAGPLVAANAAGFGPCQTNEPGELMPMDLSLSELVKDSQKRIEIMVELNRATFAIPNVTPGSHVNVESPCQQVRQAARKEKIVNSVQSVGYTVVDNANQMQCMASSSRDAFFRQMHPVAHESQSDQEK
ncbi:Hypothetical protein NTJ_11795 [Nesidiocoris tenuis]|uniref:Uncharacterized protein n=1 Tax=Nesidiocoris tenuis TaxID=355587 RepID=A0ABN7B3J2_9HEMI|nr:Hypothetical protein NTJ_11795 [Nesidiocoris tenuis]